MIAFDVEQTILIFLSDRDAAKPESQRAAVLCRPLTCREDKRYQRAIMEANAARADPGKPSTEMFWRALLSVIVGYQNLLETAVETEDRTVVTALMVPPGRPADARDPQEIVDALEGNLTRMSLWRLAMTIPNELMLGESDKKKSPSTSPSSTANSAGSATPGAASSPPAPPATA